MVGTRPTERWLMMCGWRQRRTASTERSTRIGDLGRVCAADPDEHADARVRSEAPEVDTELTTAAPARGRAWWRRSAGSIAAAEKEMKRGEE
jgi:hypothetical protein